MPDINVQYELASSVPTGADGRSKFAKRASQLAASIGQADLRISEFSDVVRQVVRTSGRKESPTSFLSSRLQPVDANRVRKSLVATEAMASPAEAAVNVIVDEDIGAVLEQAKYKGMVDQINRLEEDFENDVAALAVAA